MRKDGFLALSNMFGLGVGIRELIEILALVIGLMLHYAKVREKIAVLDVKMEVFGKRLDRIEQSYYT